MAKVTSQKKKSRLKKKADRRLQELGRELYDKCLVCGKPMVCLHHYHGKSKCSALRYDLSNCIPICHGCHMGHHTGDPNIHNKINEIKGTEWVQELEIKRRTLFIKESIGYYENIIKSLNTCSSNPH